MNNKFLPKGSLQIPKEVNRWNRQGNQPWYLYMKTAKKARQLLRILCKCRLTVYFFWEKIYSQFEIISVPVHCDVRSQTSVDRGLDFQWQVPHLLHVASIIVQPWSVITWPFYHAMLLATAAFDTLNKVCTHTFHLETKRLNSDLQI